MKMKETILAFGSHSDDLEIGMGGTIAKFRQQGKEVIGVIFSSGERSSPWLKKEYLVESRREEAKKIGEYIGCKETIFFGLKDGNLQKEVENPKVNKAIINIIKHFKPDKIFTHSKYDPHPDHKAVNRAVFRAIDEIDKDKKMNVYVFEVWNVVKEIYADRQSGYECDKKKKKRCARSAGNPP
jgi:LmbE family N-acetylglucosaminyl deacetylase